MVYKYMYAGRRATRYRDPKPVRSIIDSVIHRAQPSAAAGSVDDRVVRFRLRIKELVASGGSERFIQDLAKGVAHQSVDQLLLASGYMDLSDNARMRMARHLAYRYGRKAPFLILLLLLDVCKSDVANLGGCVAWRIARLLRGDGAGAIGEKNAERIRSSDICRTYGPGLRE